MPLLFGCDKLVSVAFLGDMEGVFCLLFLTGLLLSLGAIPLGREDTHWLSPYLTKVAGLATREVRCAGDIEIRHVRIPY